MEAKLRAPKNRTLALTANELERLGARLLRLRSPVPSADIENKTLNNDITEILDFLPTAFADLLFIDPPYNLTKSFNGLEFKEQTLKGYEKWFESWFPALIRILKKTATVYICGDWRSSTAIHRVAARYLNVRNRVTWEREKGRGAKANWKNCSEDIWYCTVSDEYTFNLDAVKIRRRVIAPYRNECGNPKDWEQNEFGDYRLTYPSNLWTDLTVPFWSMPENTDHPTQKPEKLLAKLILASSNVGDVVFDSFLGSGTTSVVAKKLERKFVGVEIDRTYCCLAEKRLERVQEDASIQGYADGIFWERNSFSEQKRETVFNPGQMNLLIE